MVWKDHIPDDISNLYEIHDFKHAAAILAAEFSEEFQEICTALRTFRFTQEDIIVGGGNESNILKNFSNILRPMGWKQKQLNASMLLDNKIIRHDTQNVDYIKGRVALAIEWIDIDKSFDRDLHAFRTYFDYDKISVGILVTRSNDLDQYLYSLYNSKGKRIRDKYGASTTHMKKLLLRLEAGNNGGCPVLVFGITQILLNKGT
jgi:CRISPR-associated protein Csd2